MFSRKSEESENCEQLNVSTWFLIIAALLGHCLMAHDGNKKAEAWKQAATQAKWESKPENAH